MIVRVKKFADILDRDGKYTHWYETDKGVRVECKEDLINYLWKSWVDSKGAERERSANENIMIFNPYKKFEL